MKFSEIEDLKWWYEKEKEILMFINVQLRNFSINWQKSLRRHLNPNIIRNRLTSHFKFLYFNFELENKRGKKLIINNNFIKIKIHKSRPRVVSLFVVWTIWWMVNLVIGECWMQCGCGESVYSVIEWDTINW